MGLDYDFNQKNSIQFVADGFISPYKERGDYLLEFNANSLDSIIKTNSEFEQRTSNMSAGFNYRHKFNNSGKEISVNLDYLDFNENSHQNLESSTFTPAEANSISTYGLTSDNPFRAKVHSVKSDFEGKIFGNIKFSSGLQSIYSARKSSRSYSNPRNHAGNVSVNKSNFSEYINSVYTSLSKEFKALSVQAGLRYESNQTAMQQFNTGITPSPLIKLNHNNLVPSFYLSYKLDSLSANQFIFSWNSRINRPSYSSLNPSAFFFDKYTVLRGNAMLQPERSRNFQLAFHHQSKLTMALVYTRSNNIIINTYQQEGKTLVSSQANVETYSNAGFNVNSILKVFPFWTANLYGELSNFSFRDKLVKGYLDIVTYRVTGNNQFKFQRGWSGEVSGSYRSKTTFGQGIFQPIWKINASIQKKLLKDKGFFTLSGSDLFHSWVSKRNIELGEAQISVVNRNDTRQVSLSFTYKFGSENKIRQHKGGLETEKLRTGAP